MTWFVDITFTSPRTIDDDATFDLMDALGGVPMGRSADLTEGQVGVFVEARTSMDAVEAAARQVRDAAKSVIGKVDIVGISAISEDKLEFENARPLFPDVVGFAEIAREAGVSRQRARQLAATESFPEPVITTAQGPLYVKAAIEAWIKNRSSNPGRPRKLVNA